MLRKLLIITATFISSSCATYDSKTNEYSDPLESFNRTMFDFNYYVLDPAVRPVAVFWADNVPVPVRQAISNASSNLAEPSSMVNSFLQGELDNGIKHMARFIINTIFGFGGLIDVVGRASPELNGMESVAFGSTLGSYDVPYGPYVVLPFYGQTTLRESFGDYVDYKYPPLSQLTLPVTIGRWAIDGIETRAKAIEFEALLKNSDDPYNFLRNAYFQQQNFLSSNGKVDASKQEKREEAISGFVDDLD